MKPHGLTSVYEFLSDFLVYRNLRPLDARLPALDDVRDRAGVPTAMTPRKSEPAYARVIVEILRAARALDAPERPLERVVYIGDTCMNDGTAFTNIARAGDWPGLAFIASEREAPDPPEIIEEDETSEAPRALYLADRWAAISDFVSFCRARDFPVDAGTAVIVDLDKTALGARGRNDHVINQARVEAVRRTVGELLGDAFDPRAFQAAYDVLNESEFHPFTADNQDYLAYICLILGSGLYELQPLMARVRAGGLTSFEPFIAQVDARRDDLALSLREIHQRIYGRVRAGDPTPFKAFRYNEYVATVERMGCLGDDASVEMLLAEEIVITEEVREAALRWKARGALLFGLSDKPDEASIPGDALARQGYVPIHRVQTHAVGEA